MADAKLNDLVSIMTDDQPPRVWSLLVSLFGDLAQGEDDAISGKTLNRIMEAIGIKPEANRVALHRLRKEGWLQSERSGRTSRYSLTDMGRRESRAATPRIYEKHEPQTDAWLVVVRSGQIETTGYMVAPNILIAPNNPDDHAVFAKRLDATDTLPDWMLEKLCKPEFATQASEAANSFQALCNALPHYQVLSSLEAAVLRVLVVHTWRRIALRRPSLPRHLMPKTWRGDEAEALAHRLLERMPVPNLAENTMEI